MAEIPTGTQFLPSGTELQYRNRGSSRHPRTVVTPVWDLLSLGPRFEADPGKSQAGQRPGALSKHVILAFSKHVVLHSWEPTNEFMIRTMTRNTCFMGRFMLHGAHRHLRGMETTGTQLLSLGISTRISFQLIKLHKPMEKMEL